MGISPEIYKELKDFAKEFDERRRHSERFIDQMIVSLSVGFLGLSAAFPDRLTSNKAPIWLLYIALGFFTLALLLVIVSNLINVRNSIRGELMIRDTMVNNNLDDLVRKYTYPQKPYSTLLINSMIGVVFGCGVLAFFAYVLFGIGG